jgi:hypothetical protein
MQQMGYQYCAEDLGVFGINRTGPDLVDRLTSMPIWADCFCDFNEFAVKKAGYEPIDIFFRGLAYRMMWKLNWDIKRDSLKLGIRDPYAFQLLKIFNEVADYMVEREILAEEKGVVYNYNQGRILWAFDDFDADAVGGKHVQDISNGREMVINKNKFKAVKNCVYKILPVS